MIRHSLNYVPWNDRKAVVADLKTVYREENADAAALRLDDFEEKWGKKYPPIGSVMATKLGAGDPVLRLSGTGPQDHLHHQCHRESEHELAENYQKPGPLPQ
jgi:putative transposase